MFNRISNLIKAMINPDYDGAANVVAGRSVDCDWCARPGITWVQLQYTDGQTLMVRACSMHQGQAHTMINDWIDQRLDRADVRRRLGLDDAHRS